ncbi:LacI family transcriptional regulator [Clostridium sporogenes]|jgi:LacI family transcriptional regulator|uniref:Catabolite control protein A n=2 Tax=Clostridium TaxID=1485 RepID=A0A0D1APR3_CLOBO|nr:MULTISPECIES: LacI family DNA-binding transcriptional regulator [Clostridium]MBE6078260.1 LacI family transcriptional regulator [Clostridium lundense]MDU2831887.1 LacI family DNA-binding transcriptional regulator [Clostridium botulinum]KIS25094.1 catabolite control protein A [Clostridium botulinum B2 450]MCW6093693.1 LacI family transcriptional regulator [Clostridium sporogenes]MCW7997032.1 LacI family transcriptional regulator [Clostridium sp. cpc1]
MAISIKDVAKEAQVSIATVSRVLNNIDVVNEDTKKKVLDAIDKLGYRPNIVARSLKTQKSKTIGIIIPDISNQFYPEIVRGAEDVANIYDYNIMLCNTDLDPEKEMEYLRVLREKMADGVLYMSNSLEKNILELIKSLQLPVVLVETKDSEEKLPSVTIDNLKASLDATEYLINKGNNNIAYIGLHEDMANAAALRYEGYKLALRKNNIKENKNLVYLGGMKVRDGYEGINKIIEKEKVDAIFCADDEIAMGAINALRDKNIKVPDNIDVMGFNNIYSSNVFYPKLTTVGQPMYDMGSVGMRMLIKIINKEELEKDDYVLQHKIVERDSCKK